MVNRMDKVIIGGLLAAVVFTPIFQGAVEPWSIAVLELVILFLLLLWAIKTVLEKRFEIAVPLTAYPIGLFLLYGFVQSVTITDGQGNISSLSIDPESTRTAVTLLFFLFAAHLMATTFFNTAGRSNMLVHFLMVFGFALAFLGLIQLVAGDGTRLWFRPVQNGSGWLTGPFVNHNHFAGYMELLIPLPVAFIITGAQKQYRILYGFAAVLMAVAVVLSASRGGMISMAAGILFAFLLGTNYNILAAGRNAAPSPAKGFGGLFSGLAVLSVITVAVFAGTLWMGIDPVLDRVADSSLISSDKNAETFESSRGWIWKTTVGMIRENPVFGIGLGAYETAYPKYSSKDEPLIVDRAHNDYLQVLSDTGLIGGVMGIGFLAAFVYGVTRIMRINDRVLGAIAIGSAAAIFSLLIHSVFDFNLQLPSTALLFLILNAVLYQIVSSTGVPKKAGAPSS